MTELIKNVMLDLETMDTGPRSAIVSIGAVAFDEYGAYEEFYTIVDLNSCTELGMTTDQSTIDWWEKQSEEVRSILTSQYKINIRPALHLFADYLEENCTKGVQVWGCGSVFDNVLLANAYDVCGMKKPWMKFRDRCYRTVRDGHRGIKTERKGVHHNALDDAKYQAEHLIEIVYQTDFSL